MHLWIGVPTAILVGIAEIVIVGGPAEVRGISLNAVFELVAIAGAVSTAVVTFLGPERTSNAHRAAGDRCNALKGCARRFREIDVHRSYNNDKLLDRLAVLVKNRDELNELIPFTVERCAYRQTACGHQW